MIKNFPSPPYYAVLFSSKLSKDSTGYEDMAEFILSKARAHEGFLGFESAREHTGISISYWESLDHIKTWKEDAEHLVAQQMGKKQWYQEYQIRICKVERDYEFQQE